jgi:hypothetical protein
MIHLEWFYKQLGITIMQTYLYPDQIMFERLVEFCLVLNFWFVLFQDKMNIETKYLRFADFTIVEI